MNMINCPACLELIRLPNSVKSGQFISCLGCNSTLEVMSIDPIWVEVYWYSCDKLIRGFDQAEPPRNKDSVRCPLCKEKIFITKKLWLGDRVYCESCGYEHQVVGINPIELDFPYDDSNSDLSNDDLEGYPYDLYKKI